MFNTELSQDVQRTKEPLQSSDISVSSSTGCLTDEAADGTGIPEVGGNIGEDLGCKNAERNSAARLDTQV